MRCTDSFDDFTAHQPGDSAWLGAVTPRRIAGSDHFRIRQSVRVSAQALWKETAPPD